MQVRNLMVHQVKTCGSEDSLNNAAHLMWVGDFGCVPVVDQDSRVVGMLTDRDICMAAYTRGASLHALNVKSAMAREVVTCAPDDDILFAEKLMRKNEIRRLPVVDAQRKLVGIISVDNIAREAFREHLMGQSRSVSDAEVTETLAKICTPRITVTVERVAA
jgi:CBS domain-containing protein